MLGASTPFSRLTPTGISTIQPEKEKHASVAKNVRKKKPTDNSNPARSFRRHERKEKKRQIEKSRAVAPGNNTQIRHGTAVTAVNLHSSTDENNPAARLHPPASPNQNISPKEKLFAETVHKVSLVNATKNRNVVRGARGPESASLRPPHNSHHFYSRARRGCSKKQKRASEETKTKKESGRQLLHLHERLTEGV